MQDGHRGVPTWFYSESPPEKSRAGQVSSSRCGPKCERAMQTPRAAHRLRLELYGHFLPVLSAKQHTAQSPTSKGRDRILLRGRNPKEASQMTHRRTQIQGRGRT